MTLQDQWVRGPFTSSSELGGQGQEWTKIYKAKTQSKILTGSEHMAGNATLFPWWTQGVPLLVSVESAYLWTTAHKKVFNKENVRNGGSTGAGLSNQPKLLGQMTWKLKLPLCTGSWGFPTLRQHGPLVPHSSPRDCREASSDGTMWHFKSQGSVLCCPKQTKTFSLSYKCHSLVFWKPKKIH